MWGVTREGKKNPMGCDIHLHVETKQYDAWLEVRNPIHEETYSQHTYRHWPGSDRYYTLFAVLADVRNRDGSVTPIATPRGLPGDASRTVKDEADTWDGDGHSHSYLTLRELVDYDWDAPAGHSTIRQQVGDFFSLMQLMAHETLDMEYARIVFWFDN